MYAFLVILGAVMSAAGLALVVAGIPAHEGAIASATITSGAVATVGGLILVGIGITVRELRRIERALAARPMPRTSRPGEAANGTAERPPVTERTPAAAAPRIPFPPKPKADVRPQPATAMATAAPPPPDDAALQRLREKFPTLARFENAPVVAEGDIPILPRSPAPSEEETAETRNIPAPVAAPVAARTNGAAAPRPMSRVEADVRPARPPERLKVSMFDAFWPKAQRGRAGAQATAQLGPAPMVAPPASAEAPAPASEPLPELLRPATAEREAPSPVSILKSGVVEGMAYTLYSDGSIEAQLPQGTLRFGSITELRTHIEKEAGS